MMNVLHVTKMELDKLGKKTQFNFRYETGCVKQKLVLATQLRGSEGIENSKPQKKGENDVQSVGKI